MKNTINIHRFTRKQIVLIILGFLALLITGYLISQPIIKQIEQNKFNTLDEQSRLIYQKIKLVAGGDEDWQYSTTCKDKHTGEWPSGIFNCTALISLDRQVNSIAELNTLHEKYYNLIDKDSLLIKTTELDPQYPSDFGKLFVVSSAEKHYVNVATGVECRYLSQLGQISESGDNFTYSTAIENGQARLVISLECSGLADDPWYKQIY